MTNIIITLLENLSMMSSASPPLCGASAVDRSIRNLVLASHQFSEGRWEIYFRPKSSFSELSLVFNFYFMYFVRFMSLRRIMVSLFILVFLFVMSPLTLAQSVDRIEVDLPSQISVDEEVVVVLEIVDEDDELVDDAQVAVSYSPSDGVVDQLILDCGDPNDFDECQVNNRGVDGVFEAVFFLLESPVTMTINADGIIKDVIISASGSSAATGSSTSSTTSASSSASTTISASSVQVGPSPSVWLILIPLALMCGVVTFVVVKS